MTQSTSDPTFEALLDYVKRNRGFDFTGYKRSSLMRRVQKRMHTIEINNFNNYLDYLAVHPEEFAQLFNTLLINVTDFFRDPLAWDYVTQTILPSIVTQKSPQDPIRIWSAGCASGQESYTLAMAIAEHIGINQFRDRVKIYATDVDEEALTYARQASYLAHEVTDLSPEMLERYFEASDDRYTFRKDLRQSVIFGRHDLIQDAPISKIDLLTCRNTLMYFNAETQAKILTRFHFALNEGGFLFLGKAEMLLSHTHIFTPTNLKCRIFTKVSKVIHLRNRLPTLDQPHNEEMVDQLSNYSQLREAAFDASSVAQIVIDPKGILAIANERARVLFDIALSDLGRPLQDLEISYRPVELRSCIDRVYADRRAMTITDVKWQTQQSNLLYLDIQIAPLSDHSTELLGTGVTFTDVSRSKRLQDELAHSNRELETAYEELQSTNEELETSNEELQSTNEELETMNEELQSTNEELETMNEELQSTNEEMQTINDELQRRSEELNHSNAFLESILTSLKGGVVVVNRDLQVQIWNYRAEDLWGLRTVEAVGQNFLNLDIGFPVEQLRPSIRSCLNQPELNAGEITLSAINRRGRTISCRVTCTPLIAPEQQVQGVILVMEETEN